MSATLHYGDATSHYRDVTLHYGDAYLHYRIVTSHYERFRLLLFHVQVIL